jgi:hypothetical protein
MLSSQLNPILLIYIGFYGLHQNYDVHPSFYCSSIILTKIHSQLLVGFGELSQ